MNPITSLVSGTGRLRALALGAHADDIEIGCGGTLLRLARQRELEVLWVVFCSTPQRADEARASAARFLHGASSSRVMVGSHRDGFLPYEGGAIKDEFEDLKGNFRPDEIPKYDGDFGTPNLFVPLSKALVETKIENLLASFPSQASKPWFSGDLFHAVARIRGMECQAPEGLAEAFYCRKLVL